MPSSEVYHVFQDSKGYIWFATDNGVSRYDGYEFKNFTKQDGLPDNTVFEIYEDYKGRVWFIPHSVQFSYYLNDSIHSYKYNKPLAEHFYYNPNPYKGSFAIDNNEGLYYGDRRMGSFFIDSTGNIYENKNLYGDYHTIISINGRFIITRPTKKNNEKFRIIQNGKEISKAVNKEPILNLLGKWDNYYIAQSNDNIFIAASNTLILIDKLSKTKTFKLPVSIIYLYTDSKNNLWIGTRNGVLFYEGSKITKNPKHYFLRNKNISSVWEDKEGGYWFTTLQDGVYYLPNLSVLNYSNTNIFYKNVYSVNVDPQNIKIGLNNKVIYFKNDINLGNEKIINLGNENLIVKSLFFDKFNNKDWILSRYLYSYQGGTLQKYHYLRNQKKSFYSPQPKDIKSRKNGEIWLASSRGLFKYKEENIFQFISKTGYDKINALCFNKDETKVYYGTNEGLWEYSLISDSCYLIGKNNNLLSSKVSCITYNNYQNNIWIGTKSNGIIVFNEGTIVEQITIKEGLSGNNITSLFQQANNIWVGTTNGLNKIELESPGPEKSTKITKYGKIHGLTSEEINDVYVTGSIVYLATKKGLNLIRYKELEPNISHPNIYIKKVKILDKDTTKYNNYDLPYYKNSIYVEYAGLMYRNNTDKRYKYILIQNGKNPGWAETTENFLRLSYLPPGNYNLKVIAINEDGLESLQPAELNFKINPPFWKTWWFSTTIILLISIITYLLFKSRVSELNKRNKIERNLLKEVNKFRQQALSQQMNPHFIFNTLNSIQFFIYENENDASVHYLSKFAKLMRIVLENSQFETIPIQKELEALGIYLELEALRFEDSFNYKINIPKDIDTQYYYIYPLLIQPYVENSIWHGLYHKEGEKNLWVGLKDNGENILCIIEDNGIGRARSSEINKDKVKIHKSLGTKITGKRIDAINKLYNRNFSVDFVDKKDKDGNPSGTKVLLNIPKISN